MKEIFIVSDNNRPNMVAEITEALADAGVNIEFLSAEIIGGSRVAILTVDHYDEALRALARITRRFADAGIELRSIRIIRYEGGTGIFAVAADRTEEAAELLKDVLISRQ